MSRDGEHRRAYLLVNLSTLLWASNLVLGRALRDQIGPVSLAAARFTVAGALFAAILLSTHISRMLGRNAWGEGGSRRSFPLLFGLALSGVFGFPILLYFALQYTTTSRVALINGTAPLLTILFTALFLGERISLQVITGALLSLAGVALVIGSGAPGQIRSLPVNAGDLIALLNAGLWGIYSVLSRIATRSRSSLEVTAVSIWLALPLFFIAAPIEWQADPPSLTFPVILSTVYIGIFPSVIAFLSWNEGVRRVGPNQAMAFYNMLAVFGVLLGVLFLGESLSWVQLLGGSLILTGGLVAARKASLNAVQSE